MRIQHNIMAMNAYRNYNTNTKALSGNLEKLSSGYKINRAGDDAAGLAISEKMRAQITGLDAAQKNVKDGISLVKTAEGAMQEIQDMLNRMDYLATQSANGTYDNDVDRANLQKEVDALKTEINRIADSANFNGIKLLDGSLDVNGSAGGASIEAKVDLSTDLSCDTKGQLHVTGKAAQTASFDVSMKEALSVATAKATIAANASFTVKLSIGGQSFAVKVKNTGATIAKGAAIDVKNLTLSATATSISLTPANGSAIKFKATFDAGTGMVSFKATSAKDISAVQAVTISASNADLKFTNAQGNEDSLTCQTQNVVNGVAKSGEQLAHGHLEMTDDILNALADGGTLKIGSAAVTFDAKSNTVAGQKVGIQDLIDEKGKLKTGADGTIDADVKKELLNRISQAAKFGNNKVFDVGVASDGKTLTLQEDADYYKPDNPDPNKLLDTAEKFQKLVSVTAKSTPGAELRLQIGDTADSYNQLKLSIGDMHVKGMGIDGVDISTQDGAAKAIDTIRNAINYVSGVRGDLGAVQNRLEHTGNNLSVMAENIQDAESTIRDTDVADEMMKYVKNNILVQSAQAMLAQANQVPQGVLQLLG